MNKKDLLILNQLEKELKISITNRQDFLDNDIKNKMFLSYYAHKNNHITELGIYNVRTFSDKHLSIISQLTFLKTLYLSRDQIQDIALLKSLTKIKILSLSINNIKDLSPLKNMKDLTTLWLSRNQLSDISQLQYLKNLTLLDLFENNITDVTPLKKLSKLYILHLSRNRITDISAMGKLTQIKKLYLSNNDIQDVTPLKMLGKLTELYLNNNKIKDLNNNKIRDITPLLALNKLLTLNVNKNDLSIPVDILLSLDAKRIFDFVTQRMKSRVEQSKIRLLVLGDGRCGKSSLIDRIMERNFDKNKQITKGIEFNIKHFTFENRKSDINLYIWDFGGQEIQHAIHESFISRALVMIVCDITGDEQQILSDFGNLRYWTQFIIKDSSIIIAITKTDKPKHIITKEKLELLYPQIPIISCSAKSENDKGRTLLLQKLRNVIQDTDEFKEGIPGNWNQIELKLEKKLPYASEGTSHYPYKISYQEYISLCESLEGKYALKTTEEQLNLLMHLDATGTIKYFKNNKRLQDKIYRTTWIANLLYSFMKYQMDNYKNNENNGTYTANKIAEIFNFELPKDATRMNEIMDIFISLRFCFSIDNNNAYIFPEFLQEDLQSSDNDYWDEKKDLYAEIAYNILPRSIIIKFICELKNSNLVTFDGKNYWRNGVIIRDYETGCLGYISAHNVYQADGKIKILLMDNNRTHVDHVQLNRLLGSILHIFNNIHNEYPQINAKITIFDTSKHDEVEKLVEDLSPYEKSNMHVTYGYSIYNNGTANINAPVNITNNDFKELLEMIPILNNKIQYFIEDKNVSKNDRLTLREIKKDLNELKNNNKESSKTKQEKITKVLRKLCHITGDIGKTCITEVASHTMLGLLKSMGVPIM